MINEQTNNEIMSKLADKVRDENKYALSRKVIFIDSKMELLMKALTVGIVSFCLDFLRSGQSSSLVLGTIFCLWTFIILLLTQETKTREIIPPIKTQHINEVLFNGEIVSETIFSGLERCDVVSVVKTNIEELIEFSILGSSARITVSTTDGRRLNVYVNNNTALKPGDELEVKTTVIIIKEPFAVVGTDQEVKVIK